MTNSVNKSDTMFSSKNCQKVKKSEIFFLKRNVSQENQHTVISSDWTLENKGLFSFCLPALLGIHKNSTQKEFFRSSEGFLR